MHFGISDSKLLTTFILVHFKQIWQYEDLVGLIDVIVHRLLEETHYNTVNNFVDLYESFKQSKSTDLRAFFQSFTPPINRRHHMCVSLAMEVVSRISEVCPQLSDHLYLVSCEEAVEAIQQYILNCKQLGIDNAMYNLEKEHSMVAMRINVAGREGIMVLDPGYHIARAVTVMKDQCYPHTGWFIQSDEPHLKREYCYKFNALNDEFVEWFERTTRGDQVNHDSSLIYIKNPYRTAIDVTVRRNLVYNFRSLLSRDAKGRVCAGIYFPVTKDQGGDSTFTLFYDGSNGQSIKIKTKFNTFADEQKVNFLSKGPISSIFFSESNFNQFCSQIPEAMMNHLENLSAQIRLNKSELCALLKSLCDVMSDRDFIKQLLAINDHITAMSADN